MNYLKIIGTLLVIAIMFTSLVLADGNAPKTKVLPSSSHTGGDITWYDYDAGLVKAKAEDKHIFINFTTSWCGYCKKMNKSTFIEPEIVTMLNSNFVAIMVDGDSRHELDIDGYKITERDLTKKEYGVGSYPLYFFLKPDGEKLGALRGYQFKDQLMQYLTYVNDRKYDTTATDQGSK